MNETDLQASIDRRLGCFQPYSRYEDSGVEWLGPIPDHWQVHRFKRLAALNPTNGELLRLSDADEVSFVPMESIGEHGGLDSSEVRALADVRSGYTSFQDGDVIIAKITPCFENGKGALARGLENGVAIGTTELHVIRVGPLLDEEFAFYVTVSWSFRRLGVAEMYGSGGQKRVPEAFVEDYPVALPPLIEQRTITAFLDRETARIDALINKKERLIDLLREQRSTLISHAVSRGLDPDVPLKDSGVEWLGPIPDHWQVRRLKLLASLVEDKVSAQAPDGPYVALEHLESWTGKKATEFPYEIPDSATVRFRKGDVLFGKLRPYLAKAYCPTFRGHCSSEILVFRPRGEIHALFLCYQLLSKPLIHLLSRMAYGTKMPRVDPGGVANMSVTLPPLSEQQAITAFLDRETARIDELVEKVQVSIDLLREYRSALITAAVTGKIDVREAVENGR